MDYIENSLVLSSELGDSGAHNPEKAASMRNFWGCSELSNQRRGKYGLPEVSRIIDSKGLATPLSMVLDFQVVYAGWCRDQ
jgi:hypothetical protein